MNYRFKCTEPLTLDFLVSMETNANFFISCVGGNWGNDFVMMLLPNFEGFDDLHQECKINISCLYVPDGTCEESYLLDQWMKEYPNSPFIISGKSIQSCLEEMDRRVRLFGNDCESFNFHFEEFNKWRVVSYYVSCNPVEYKIEDGWRLLIEEAFEFINDKSKI